jgi:hypothetical protein
MGQLSSREISQLHTDASELRGSIEDVEKTIADYNIVLGDPNRTVEVKRVILDLLEIATKRLQRYTSATASVQQKLDIDADEYVTPRRNQETTP